MHPLIGSPVIDEAASGSFGGSVDDQRGDSRPGNPGDDLGAVEVPEPGFAAQLLLGLAFLMGLGRWRERA